MKINAWHRRHALCVASSLPDDPEDAWAILECVRDLVTYVHSDSEKPATACGCRCSGKIRYGQISSELGTAWLE
jgi:hypothetical protein